MSNYIQYAFHPVNKVMQPAVWIDDYLFSHNYGVLFFDMDLDEDGKFTLVFEDEIYDQSKEVVQQMPDYISAAFNEIHEEAMKVLNKQMEESKTYTVELSEEELNMLWSSTLMATLTQTDEFGDICDSLMKKINKAKNE